MSNNLLWNFEDYFIIEKQYSYSLSCELNYCDKINDSRLCYISNGCGMPLAKHSTTELLKLLGYKINYIYSWLNILEETISGIADLMR